MKKIGLLLCFIFFVGTGFAQDAQGYFDKGSEYLKAGNYSQAIPYYKSANELIGGNNSACQFMIGLCYDLIEDCMQAVYWYRKAAEQGDADAQYKLGECYVSGRGVTKDLTQAVDWYRKAAEQGQADAQFSLGISYFAKQDYTQAVYWYRKAAEQGVANAQFFLGMCYDIGEGVTEDYAQAVYWYRKAAEQGAVFAQY